MNGSIMHSVFPLKPGFWKPQKIELARLPDKPFSAHWIPKHKRFMEVGNDDWF